MKKYKIILSVIYVLCIIVSFNFVSKAQNLTDNYSGMYYSDTITDSPSKSHVYIFRLVKDVVEINKINIERRDTTISISVPGNNSITKKYKYFNFRQTANKILYEAQIQTTSKLNEFDVVSIKDLLPILKVQFSVEFMIIRFTNLQDLREGAKLYKYVTYDINGLTKAIGGYKNGKKHGYWLIYNDDNTITTEDYSYGYIR
jgi:hypothetical protein